jgi:hypothetical protein
MENPVQVYVEAVDGRQFFVPGTGSSLDGFGESQETLQRGRFLELQLYTYLPMDKAVKDADE